ncbi:hypothetical protein V1264_004430 [Littorina saxatilis]|uniref:Uncharacterized protein n=1 Tax=Littorina saxatilis TaxID=31220 RepID=A0AAN9B2E4_9CAEN
MILLSMILFVFGWSGAGAQSQCEFPEKLVGRNMTSNSLGVVFFDNKTTLTLMEGFRDCVSNCPPIPLSFVCSDSRNDQNGIQYFLRSETSPLGVRLNMCWYLSRVTDDKWVYYQGPQDYNTYYYSYVIPDDNANMASTCNLTSPLPVDRYNLLLDTATLTSQGSVCPDIMLGDFSTTLNDATSSCATHFTICNPTARQTITINDTSCTDDAYFTDGGKMDCLHSLAQGNVTYIMTFAPTSDPVSFACMVCIYVLILHYYEGCGVGLGIVGC